MMNNLLNVIVLGALVGTFAFAPTPESRSIAPRTTQSEPAAVPSGIAASSPVSAHKPPVPVVRSVRAMPATVSAPATAPEASVQEATVQPQDGLDKTAARTAIEADGYRGVNVLGKAADGTWRAKAYRGTTEVQVTVDGSGRVSAE